MDAAIRKIPQNDASVFTVEYWRQVFDDLYGKLEQKDRDNLFHILVSLDPTYDTVKWYNGIRNVKRSRSSLAITKAVCETLEPYIEKLENESLRLEKLLKRQKLT
jgi:hypothetical protein